MPFQKKNNRKHQRASFCRLVKVQLMPSSTKKKTVHLLNLSETGMKFHVVDLSTAGLQLDVSESLAEIAASLDLSKIKEGDTLSFCLHLGPEHSDIRAQGKLVWVDHESRAEKIFRIRAGVQFINLSELDGKRIQRYVAAFDS